MTDSTGPVSPSELVVRRAIDWHIQLSSASGAERERIREAINLWCAEYAEHALAWERVALMSSELHDMTRRLPEQTASLSILEQTRRELDRRRAIKLLVAGCAVGSTGLWFGRTALPWRADYVTATGEHRRIILADGTRVILNTNSALDVVFDAHQRRLILAYGEVLMESGPDSAMPRYRPLRLACRHGVCEALGTRFSVRDDGIDSQLSVSHGRVALSQFGVATEIVDSGETVSFDGASPAHVVRPAVAPTAWSEGLLIVTDIRLDAFVDELARYHHGIIGCDDTVAGLRLSGVFQLDSRSVLLRHLERTLPVRAVSRTRWWIRIEAV